MLALNIFILKTENATSTRNEDITVEVHILPSHIAMYATFIMRMILH